MNSSKPALTRSSHTHADHRQVAHTPAASRHARAQPTSVLAWPAWQRVLAVLPLVLALWLAVWWANEGAPLW